MKDNFVPPGPLITPVLFMIFNRPDTTQQVFNAIRQAKPEQLFVAADGSRKGKEGEKEKCKQARKVIEQIDWSCEVKTLFRNKNLGCKIAVSSAIDWFFENVEEGIILEDDCLPSQSFFWFCQELLEKYKNNKKVWLISGFNILGYYKKTPYSYEFTTTESIWGWATWKRAWSFYDVEMKLWKNLKAVEKWKKFLKDKEELEMDTKFYELTYNEKINTWDYQWSFISKVHGGLTITSTQNLILNIGMNEHATHTKKSNNTFNKMKQHKISFPLKHPDKVEPNRKFSKRIFKKTSNPLNIIKKYIIKIPVLYNFLRSFKNKKDIFFKRN